MKKLVFLTTLLLLIGSASAFSLGDIGDAVDDATDAVGDAVDDALDAANDAAQEEETSSEDDEDQSETDTETDSDQTETDTNTGSDTETDADSSTGTESSEQETSEWEGEDAGIKYRIDDAPSSLTIGNTHEMTVTVQNTNAEAREPYIDIFVNGKLMESKDVLVQGSRNRNPTKTTTVQFRVSGNKNQYDDTEGKYSWVLNHNSPATLAVGQQEISGSSGNGHMAEAIATRDGLSMSVADLNSNPIETSDAWILGSGTVNPPTRMTFRVKARNTGPVPAEITPSEMEIDGLSTSDTGEVKVCDNEYANNGCTTEQDGSVILDPGKTEWIFFKPKISGEMIYDMGYRLDNQGQTYDVEAGYDVDIPATAEEFSFSATDGQEIRNTFRYPFRNPSIYDTMVDKFDEFNRYEVNIDLEIGERIDKSSEELKVFSKWDGDTRASAGTNSPEGGDHSFQMIGKEGGTLRLEYQEGSLGQVSDSHTLPSGDSPITVNYDFSVPREQSCESHISGTLENRNSSKEGEIRIENEGSFIDHHKPLEGGYAANSELEDVDYEIDYIDLACDSSHRVVYRVKEDGSWVEKASHTFSIPFNEPVEKTIDLDAQTGDSNTEPGNDDEEDQEETGEETAEEQFITGENPDGSSQIDWSSRDDCTYRIDIEVKGEAEGTVYMTNVDTYYDRPSTSYSSVSSSSREAAMAMKSECSSDGTVRAGFSNSSFDENVTISLKDYVDDEQNTGDIDTSFKIDPSALTSETEDSGETDAEEDQEDETEEDGSEDDTGSDSESSDSEESSFELNVSEARPGDVIGIETRNMDNHRIKIIDPDQRRMKEIDVSEGSEFSYQLPDDATSGTYRAKAVLDVDGDIIQNLGNQVRNTLTGPVDEEEFTVYSTDSQWLEYCSRQGYDETTLSGKTDCIREEITSEYFEGSTGDLPGVADSLCQDLYGYDYSSQQNKCVS